MANKMPKRLQRKRIKGYRFPEGAIYIGRWSKWGNPFTKERYGRGGAVDMFQNYIGHPNSPLGFEPEEIEELRGKDLMCWCSLDEACHGDVLLRIANA